MDGKCDNKFYRKFYCKLCHKFEHRFYRKFDGKFDHKFDRNLVSTMGLNPCVKSNLLAQMLDREADRLSTTEWSAGGLAERWNTQYFAGIVRLKR